MERRRHFRSLMSLGIVAALVGAVALANGVPQLSIYRGIRPAISTDISPPWKRGVVTNSML